MKHAIDGYLDNNKEYQIVLDCQIIDYRLLSLILQYHRLFKRSDPLYSHQYLWIIKPIASSRGAGITLVKANK